MSAMEPQVIPGLAVCQSISKALHMTYESGAPNLRLLFGEEGVLKTNKGGISCKGKQKNWYMMYLKFLFF